VSLRDAKRFGYVRVGLLRSLHPPPQFIGGCGLVSDHEADDTPVATFASISFLPMWPTAENQRVFGESLLVDTDAVTLMSRPVTVADAFRATLDALMRARGMNGVALTNKTGLSSATVTRMLTGERFASATVLEQLRQAFDVTPAELFDPDAALAQLGLRRDTDTNIERRRHTSVAPVQADHLSLPPLSPETGGPEVQHKDPELLAALERYWNDLDTEQRIELVGHGNRLRKSTASAAPSSTAGFRAG
jgi:transcriptional regulator with XRE-family HTH domain